MCQVKEQFQVAETDRTCIIVSRKPQEALRLEMVEDEEVE